MMSDCNLHLAIKKPFFILIFYETALFLDEENEDVGQIMVFGIYAGACHFCLVQLACMHITYAGRA